MQTTLAELEVGESFPPAIPLCDIAIANLQALGSAYLVATVGIRRLPAETRAERMASQDQAMMQSR